MKITLTEEKEIELGPAPIIRGLRIGNTEYDVVLHQFHQTDGISIDFLDPESVYGNCPAFNCRAKSSGWLD